MAARTSLRSLITPVRNLSTSAIHRLPDSSSSYAPSSSSGPSFSALSSIFSSVPPASSPSTSASNRPSAHTPERADVVRGYAPESLPPKIDPLLDLFTNLIMVHGRKAEAQRRVSEILSLIQRTANSSPQPLLARAVILSSPYVRVSSTRRRAKIIQTPQALNERQRTRQGIMWLLKAAERGRKAGLPRNQRIAREVFAVLEGQSDVYKWLEERHRLATANRSNLNIR